MAHNPGWPEVEQGSSTYRWIQFWAKDRIEQLHLGLESTGLNATDTENMRGQILSVRILMADLADAGEYHG